MDRGLTNSLSEIPFAQCIILVGTNIAECQPTIMPYFEKAKENGAFIIAIDPRETATTKIADLHLKLKPGSDAALANGILKVLIEENYLDERFLQERVNGFEEVIQYVASLEFNIIEEITGVPLEEVYQAARMFGQRKTGMIFTARGVEQQTDGSAAVQNFLNILLSVGKIGKPGCGYGAITGQGNGQGAREHGQKADQLPGYRKLDDPAARAHVAGVWGVDPDSLPGPGRSAYELLDALGTDIRALLLMGSNPVVSAPH